MLSDDSMQSQGGKARAEALTAEQRAEIARKAAEARWAIPVETHSGPLKIGEIEIMCHVLSDGTRLVSQEGVNRGLGRRGRPKAKHEENQGLQLPVFLQANNLQPFIPQEDMGVFKPIKFKRQTGGAYSIGYRAEILPKTCHVFLDAKEAGKLVQMQQATAERCRILSRGLSEVGIIALVDEATGYQEVRDRAALAKILERYLMSEARKWERMFQIDYYKELFRLQGWTFDPDSNARTPYLGKLTNNIIYDRLQPGIRKKLDELNPKIETSTGRKRRKHTHHQFFTGEVGVPELKEHLSNVTVLMKVSKDWDHFIDMLDKVKPRVGETLKLALEFDQK
jgi:hypothetical protein